MALSWGRSIREVSMPGAARVIWPRPSPPPQPWAQAVHAAVRAPRGAPPLESLLAGAGRICVIVPDRTRKDVATPVLEAIAPLLRGVEVTLWVASGKHPPQRPPAPGVRVHDAGDPDLVRVGRTRQGTEVSYPPGVLEADLRILVGEIRPHYFAGYAGGAKALFPGVAGATGIWHNHTLKAAPGARLGQVEGNPCRADMEEAAALAGPAFLINVVRGDHGAPVGVVAGDPILAHREGVGLARRIFEVDVPAPARVVVVSDTHPVTMNLYQACKLLPPAGAVLLEGGWVILVASCHEGLGPVQVINEAIYRLGVRHALPQRHRIVLVSQHGPEAVAPTFAEHAPDVATALAMAGVDGEADLLVLPRAGDLVPRLSR